MTATIRLLAQRGWQPEPAGEASRDDGATTIRAGHGGAGGGAGAVGRGAGVPCGRAPTRLRRRIGAARSARARGGAPAAAGVRRPVRHAAGDVVLSGDVEQCQHAGVHVGQRQHAKHRGRLHAGHGESRGEEERAPRNACPRWCSPCVCLRAGGSADACTSA